MNRIVRVIAVGMLLPLAAACSTPAGQVVDNAIVGSLAGAGMGSAAMMAPPPAAATAGASGPPAGGGPDYGPQKPQDHCGNGTMVHLGSVICSP